MAKVIKNAISSEYLRYKIDEDISIYEGRFCIYLDRKYRCSGIIYYKMTPPISINFKAQILFVEDEDVDLELDYGRMPVNDNEVVVLVNIYDFAMKDELDKALKHTYYINGDTTGIGVKIVGVKYIEPDTFIFHDNVIYGNKKILDEFLMYMNIVHSDIVVNINERNCNF